MDPRLKALLDSIHARNAFAGVGIGLASAYVSTLAGPLGAKGLAAHLNIDAARLNTALKEASEKLVYTDPGADVTAGAIKATDGGIYLFGKSDQPDDKRKELGDSAVMKFENILTTKDTDRDNDDLDPAGAEVDPKAPLLWQHLPDAPIGRMYSVLEQNSNYVKTACGIADTQLGRDAAVLVEFGALRISHGFKPKEFEPKNGKEDGSEGWKIKRYSVMEVSLVSIPANTGAVITAFEKGKLSHPLVKGYATALNAARPKMVVGGWQKDAGDGAGGANGANNSNVNVVVNLDAAKNDILKEVTAKLATVATDLTKGLDAAIAKAMADAKAGAAGKKDDGKTDDKPADLGKTDDKPADQEGDAGNDKTTPAAFREVMDAVKALAKDKSLPPEAAARANLVLSMLKEAGAKIAEYMKAIADAGKAMDVAGVAEHVAGLVAECHGLLSRAADEMGRVGEVAGLSDGAVKAVGETRNSVTAIAAALDDLVGGAAGATDAASSDDPPIDPVDDDDQTDNTDTTTDDQTSDDGVTPSPDTSDNPETPTDTPADAGNTGTDDDTDDDDTETEDGKANEINDGDANPGVDDEPNPGMSDADKAAAKALAELFGEPDAVYDRATLDMIRELSAAE